MADPFSAIPTPFEVDGRRPALLRATASGTPSGSPRACTRTRGSNLLPRLLRAAPLDIRDGALEAPADGVIHFAFPAAHWWDDIGST